MTSELATERATGVPADAPTNGAGPATAPDRIGQAFDPFLLSGPPPADPGARQAAWTLAMMLRRRVRDRLALAERPLETLIAGADLGWLAVQLRAWGVRRTLLVDAGAAGLASATALAEAVALEPAALSVAPAPPAGERNRFDLVIADGRDGADVGLDLATLLGLSPELLVLSGDRIETRRLLRAAGAEKVRVVAPPTDAERRFVTLELSLLSAVPA